MDKTNKACIENVLLVEDKSGREGVTGIFGILKKQRGGQEDINWNDHACASYQFTWTFGAP
jgi:hypothetical protein